MCDPRDVRTRPFSVLSIRPSRIKSRSNISMVWRGSPRCVAIRLSRTDPWYCRNRWRYRCSVRSNPRASTPSISSIRRTCSASITSDDSDEACRFAASSNLMASLGTPRLRFGRFRPPSCRRSPNQAVWPVDESAWTSPRRNSASGESESCSGPVRKSLTGIHQSSHRSNKMAAK